MHTSLFSLARPEMESFLPERASIGILGLGKIGGLAARVLQHRPQTRLWLLHRRVEQARCLAQQLSHDHVQLLEWKQGFFKISSTP